MQQANFKIQKAVTECEMKWRKSFETQKVSFGIKLSQV